MVSFRRSTSVLQRDGPVPNGDVASDTSHSPKPSHSRIFLILGRLLNSWLSSLDFLMESDRIVTSVHNVFFQRSSRPVERTKTKGLFLKGAVFKFFICFLLGIFIGFTSIPMMDISKASFSRHEAFSFREEPMVKNLQKRMTSESIDILPTKKAMLKENITMEISADFEMSNKTLNGISSLPALAVVSPKLLIIITATFAQPFQSFYLTRLAQTLRNVPSPLLWIVVEMSFQTGETAKILRDTGVMYRHLVFDQNVTSLKDGVIQQRNVALSHIEKHQLDGIVYFADDGKIYSVELFDEMRGIRRFGTWPVAVVTEDKKRVFIEGPVCNGSQVVGWHTNQRSKLPKRFPIDMSEFAFNSTILWDPKRWHRPSIELIRLDTVREGFQVSKFVEQLVEDESHMEGMAHNCSRVLVWHLHLESPQFLYPNGWFFQRNLEAVIPLSL